MVIASHLIMTCYGIWLPNHRDRGRILCGSGRFTGTGPPPRPMIAARSDRGALLGMQTDPGRQRRCVTRRRVHRLAGAMRGTWIRSSVRESGYECTHARSSRHTCTLSSCAMRAPRSASEANAKHARLAAHEVHARNAPLPRVEIAGHLKGRLDIKLVVRSESDCHLGHGPARMYQRFG